MLFAKSRPSGCRRMLWREIPWPVRGIRRDRHLAQAGAETPAADLRRRREEGLREDRQVLGDAWLANGLPPGKLESMLGELRKVAGREVPVSVFNASSDLKDLEAYAQLSAERVLLGLPTLPQSETLRQLDNLPQVATDAR